MVVVVVVVVVVVPGVGQFRLPGVGVSVGGCDWSWGAVGWFEERHGLGKCTTPSGDTYTPGGGVNTGSCIGVWGVCAGMWQ